MHGDFFKSLILSHSKQKKIKLNPEVKSLWSSDAFTSIVLVLSTVGTNSLQNKVSK